MKRRWLRWVGLLLLIEVCLYFAGACRPCFDYSGAVNCSRPLLLLNKGRLTVSTDGRRMRQFDIDDEMTRKIEDYIRKNNPAHAWRTREWQLLDSHGRVLLNSIQEGAKFAYNPTCDVLAWQNGNPDLLYIHEGSKIREVRTWTILSLPRVNADGTIWLGEDNPMHTGGIAVLDKTGRFLGWRAGGYSFSYCEMAADADETVLPLIEKLLARPEDRDSKGF